MDAGMREFNKTARAGGIQVTRFNGELQPYGVGVGPVNINSYDSRITEQIEISYQIAVIHDIGQDESMGGRGKCEQETVAV